MPDPGLKLGDPAGLPGGAILLGPLQPPQLGQVARHLWVGGRAHRSNPADQGPGAFGPLVGEAGPAILDGEPQTLKSEVAAVPHQGALEVEAAEAGLPLVEVTQPRPHVLVGPAPVVSRAGELRPDLAGEQLGGDGGARVDPHRTKT